MGKRKDDLIIRIIKFLIKHTKNEGMIFCIARLRPDKGEGAIEMETMTKGHPLLVTHMVLGVVEKNVLQGIKMEDLPVMPDMNLMDKILKDTKPKSIN